MLAISPLSYAYSIGSIKWIDCFIHEGDITAEDRWMIDQGSDIGILSTSVGGLIPDEMLLRDAVCTIH